MARPNGKDRGLFERPKGSGIWWVRYHDHKGKERRAKIGLKSEAKAYYQEMKSKVAQVHRHPELEEKLFGEKKKAMTLAELLESYRPELEKTKSSSDMVRFIANWTRLIGDLPITEISKEHAKKRQAARLDRGLAPATINRESAFLKAILNRALDEELLEKNPLARFKMLPENNVSDRFMLEAEEERIRAQMAPDDFELLAIAADTGLRQAEQFKLSWPDIHFEDGGWISVKEAKGEKRRTVPLTQRAFEILQRRYNARTSAWVFSNAKRRPMSANNFYKRRFLPALAAAGVEELTWHQAGRHTCGSRMALEGVPIQKIAQILGHSQTKTTERYAHLLPESARSSISALDRRQARFGHLVSDDRGAASALDERSTGTSGLRVVK